MVILDLVNVIYMGVVVRSGIVRGSRENIGRGFRVWLMLVELDV